MKKTLMWVCSVFFMLATLVYMPSIASVLFAIVAIATFPIKKWQDFIKGVIPKKFKWIKTWLIVVIAIWGIMISPTEGDATVNDAIVADTTTIEKSMPEELTENAIESSSTLEVIETSEATEAPEIEETPEIAEVPEVEEKPEATEMSEVEEVPETTEVSEVEETPEATDVLEVEETPETTEKSEVIIIPTPEIESYFEVHYLDVGQADAALVLCDDRYMLIDGGNTDDSRLIYTYLKNRNVDYLDYIFASHAHEDHVGGLSGALNYATVGNVYCPVTEYDSEPFNDFKKYVEKAGVSITVPSVGDTFKLGSSIVEILGINGGSEVNDTSIILKVTYGDTTFLFTGDAERVAEQTVLNSGCDLSATVLKVGHHGSVDSTSYPFLREVMPAYAIISAGEDNNYGHPTDNTLSRLRDADVKVYRTDLQGDIIATSNGESVTITVEKNPDADTLEVEDVTTPVVEPDRSIIPTPETEVEVEQPVEQRVEPQVEQPDNYAVNGKNGKIHMVGQCAATGTGKNAMKQPVYFGTYEEAESYSMSIAPKQDKRRCGNCW